MSSGNDQRVRHVAIVLQSLDSPTARQLLAQLPPDIARQVKHAMVHLGPISQQERAIATESVGGLLGVQNPPSSSASLAATATVRETPSSPASELLALQATGQIDEVSFTNPTYSPQTSPVSPSLNPSAPLYPSMRTEPPKSPNSSLLSTMTPSGLAEILMAERPIVIATVLNQVPLERAIDIVQLLPMQLSTATLAILPHLHLTDPEVLKDIQSEMHRKIGAYQQPRQAAAEGISKLHAIVAGLPSHQQSVWTQAIAHTNPALAGSMGWNVVQARELGSSNTPNDRTVGSYPTTSPSSSEPKLPHPDPGTVVAAPMATQPSPQDRFESLAQLSDDDFVTVLHRCKPNDVLLALCGASRRMLARVERLVPPRDLKRFRTRIGNPGSIALRDIDHAQSNIADVADALQTAGDIDLIDSPHSAAA